MIQTLSKLSTTTSHEGLVCVDCIRNTFSFYQHYTTLLSGLLAWRYVNTHGYMSERWRPWSYVAVFMVHTAQTCVFPSRQCAAFLIGGFARLQANHVERSLLPADAGHPGFPGSMQEPLSMISTTIKYRPT